MKYDWHKEHIRKVIKRITDHARKYTAAGIALEGWLTWFEREHPAVNEKYTQLQQKINAIWGNQDTDSMERFKKLCREFEEVEIWVFDRYVAQMQATTQ